jgi:hypothetical protein
MPLIFVTRVVIGSLIVHLCCLNVSGIKALPKDRAHQHPAGIDMLSEIAPGVTIVRIDSRKVAVRQNLCRSKDRRFIAFITSGESERLFVEDTHLRVVSEVRGIPLEYRPFNDLGWTAKNRLKFDRWSQPHQGMHYELDMRSMRLVVAFAFTG